jgi:hypothetical protein
MDLPAPVSPVSTVKPGPKFEIQLGHDDHVAQGQTAEHG